MHEGPEGANHIARMSVDYGAHEREWRYMFL